MLLKNVPIHYIMAIGNIQKEACFTAKIRGAPIARLCAVGATNGQRIGLK